MLIVPATSSDSPPKMTTRGRPSAESPAVTAKGTVSPSLKPMVKLEMRCARKLVASVVLEPSASEEVSVVSSVKSEDEAFSEASMSLLVRSCVGRKASLAEASRSWAEG